MLQPTAYMVNFLGPWAALEVAEKGVLASVISNEAKVQFMGIPPRVGG